MPALDQYALLDLIAEGAHTARPDDPEAVSTRQFDDITAEDPRFTGLPRARSLSRIFLQGWTDLVALALMEGTNRARALSHRADAQEVSWFDHDQAEFALRLVSRRLGGIATFTPDGYRRERETLRTQNPRSGAVVPLVLPTENQIVALFGNWDDALSAAGLQPRTSETGAGDERAPRQASGRSTPSIVEVLERCYQAHGVEPNSADLALFARANGIPYPRLERGRLWRDYVDEWKEDRREQGLDVPDGPPPKRERPDYTQDMGAGRDGEQRINGWDDERITPWLVQFLNQLPRDRRPTQRVYTDWASRTPGAPGTATIGRHGGLTRHLNLARRAPGAASPSPH